MYTGLSTVTVSVHVLESERSRQALDWMQAQVFGLIILINPILKMLSTGLIRRICIYRPIRCLDIWEQFHANFQLSVEWKIHGEQ